MDTPAIKDMNVIIPKMIIIAPVGLSLLSLPTLKPAPSESMPSPGNNDLEGSDVGEVDMICVNENYLNRAITKLKGLVGFDEVIPLKKLKNNKSELNENQSTTISTRNIKPLPKIDYKYDCFLAHEWGTNATGNKTHERVKDVKFLLQNLGLKVWLDEDRLKDDISTEIIQGVNDSRKIIVFITERYIERLKYPKNNCTKEFCYCVKKKDLSDIIPVVFDEAVEDISTWDGLLLFHLPDKLYINLSTDELMKKNIPVLRERIKSSIV